MNQEITPKFIQKVRVDNTEAADYLEKNHLGQVLPVHRTQNAYRVAYSFTSLRIFPGCDRQVNHNHPTIVLDI